MCSIFYSGDNDMRALFATTAFGLEELLKSELEALGAKYCHIFSRWRAFSS
ncbi:hypothetical protein ARSQ2_01914 [Arsenophonus endosymbiont of Bemisia tabaci Q2]|nr:hypothetical protein ARSQ2_01914 [Arsenophonus endosymbiont of Bemisia tabaci Q2]